MEKQQEGQPGPTKRDGETLLLLGTFLVVFAIATLLGGFWPMNYRQRTVNTVAGSILLVIGSGALLWAKSIYARIRQGNKQ